MFEANTYIQRRKQLKEQIRTGLILFLGNLESPMNYPDNAFQFRQDSTFLYYWGLDFPGLAATIDIEEDKEIIYGNDLTIDEIVWMGPQPLLREKSEKVGVKESAPLDKLEAQLKSAIQQGKQIHFLPQYRADNMIKLGDILGVNPSQINPKVSQDLRRAVAGQRSIKSDEEIEQIEEALDITYEMHMLAMRKSKPGMIEREISGAMEGIALSMGGFISYPIIFSIHGETLHNHYHGNTMKVGDIALNDCGSDSAMRYASDITRTFPIGGKFTDKQKEIYQIVYDSLEAGIKAVKPGAKFKDIHLLCSRHMTQGLKELGLMKGDVDSAVEAGAHAIFFQCGTGHMMGLDVHDMEDIGEEIVGYDGETQRSDQFGLCYLRMAKALEPGYVVTVEPGVYFIPELIDRWKAENKFIEYINYDMFEKYKDFGGIRIEDDLVVTGDGYRILGKPIPKTIEDVEETTSD